MRINKAPWTLYTAILALICVHLFNGCTAAQKAEALKIERATVAAVRSAAIYGRGALAAVRAHSMELEEAAAIIKQIAPPGSDLSALDDEARAAIETIRTTDDRQLAETALELILQHTMPAKPTVPK